MVAPRPAPPAGLLMLAIRNLSIAFPRPGGEARVVEDEPDGGERQHRLAGARLADDAEALAAADLDRDVLAIAAAVLGLNLLGDGLAARLDPRRRQAS
jgi:hypothetical protein